MIFKLAAALSTSKVPGQRRTLLQVGPGCKGLSPGALNLKINTRHTHRPGGVPNAWKHQVSGLSDSETLGLSGSLT